MRAFIAVDLEDEGIRKSLEEVQRVMKRTGAIMKLVEPRNFHITLKFLGEIEDSLVPRIERTLRESIAFRPFEISLKGLGAFPHPSRPRVVFVHVVSDVMPRLMEAVDKAMNTLGFELETRGYVPHLTIARVKARGYLLTDVIERFEDREFGKMVVKEIRLKRSKLTPQGPIYSTIFSLPLSGE